MKGLTRTSAGRRRTGFWISFGAVGLLLPGSSLAVAASVGDGGRAATAAISGPSTPLHVELTIDSVPLAGQPAEVTCAVASKREARGVVATIEPGAGATLTDGDREWRGDLDAGEEIRLAARVVFPAPGNFSLSCRALGVIDEKTVWGDLDSLYFSIGYTESARGFTSIPPESRDLPALEESPGEGFVVATGPRPSSAATGIMAPEPPSTAPLLAAAAPSVDNGSHAPGSLTVTGRFRYYDRSDGHAAEQLLAQVVRGDNSAHLAWCFTDVDGYFSCGPFTNPGAAGVRARYYAYTALMGDVLVTINPDWGTSGVSSNAFAVTTTVQVFADGTHDIGWWVVSNGSTYERAYWIVADLIEVWKYVWFGAGAGESPPETTGPSTVEWKIDSVHGTHYHHGGNIHLEGSDPLSDTVVGHEYGHNIMYTVYGNWMPTSYCPSPHYIESASHVNCAWVEGWANFLPLAVNDDPVYRWASGASLDLETPTWGTAWWDDGDDVEGRVAGALWDILDAVDDGDDAYSDGGIGSFWDTLYHQNDSDFSLYWTAWKERGHNEPGAVMSIYQNTIDYRVSAAPDLFVESPLVSKSTLNPGETFSMSATTHNLGTGASSATTLRYLLSTNETITSADTQLASDAVPPLAPGGSAPNNSPVDAPSIPGTYWVGVCAETVSGESDTGNNCSPGMQITVEPWRELSVSRLGTGSGTVSSTPAGISCGSDCSELYASGTLVVLTAVPDWSSQFDGWGGDADCSDGSVTLIGDRSCTATFGPCSIAEELILSNSTVVGTEAHQACNRIKVGPAAVIAGAGRCTLRAGNEVVFEETFRIEAGGELTVVIGPPE